MFNYEKFVNDHSREYGSCPFWSWNDKLDTEELCRQIDHMKSLGMTGFFIHARGGLKTEYFGEEWFQAVKTCVKYAEERDMQAWLYDENGWPSGFANRKLLEDSRNWSCYLSIERTSKFPDEIMKDEYSAGILAVYSMSDGKPIRITSANNSKEYILIKQNFENSYVDTLNINITQQFLEYVYEEYRKRFPDDLGAKHMPGFFTDEPQYFRYATPWSCVIPRAFEEKYGYHVLDALPALFLEYEGACEKRYDYWRLLHEMFLQNWIRPIYEWCDKHGCKLTGHAIEESALFTQMWCCGGVMPFYEYEHIPGVDHLGRNIDPGLEAKQVGSVAAQLGKKRVLAEIFACSGYDASPRELKSIVDSMYVDGVNFVCQHLYPYSSRGERKYDHPIHFSELLPWHAYIKQLNEYQDKIGCMLSLGEDLTDILVLHPMHSAYLYYRREEDRTSIETLEVAFMSCLTKLWSEHMLFHLGDETLIAKYGSVKDNCFVIGNCQYHTVIMPDMDTIDEATADLLEQYLQNGGKLICMGRTPKYMDGRRCELNYISNTTLEALKAEQQIQIEYHGPQRSMLKFAVRKHKGDTLLFLTNLTDVQMKNIMISEMPGQSFTLEPHASCMILNGECVLGELDNCDIRRKEMALDNRYQVAESTENYLTLDFARISFDGKTYSEKKPLMLIAQELLEKKQHGNIWLQFEYHVSENTGALYLIVEPQQYRSIVVNGAALQKEEEDWRVERQFLMYDIAKETKLGWNTVEMCFEYSQNEEIYDVYFGNGTESLRNCMAFDTEISPIYIMGRFVLTSLNEEFWKDGTAFCHHGDFSICRPQHIVSADNLTVAGYPFFYGKIELKQKFAASQKAKEIRVDGYYGVCEVSINGIHVGECVLGTELDISNFVTEGENELTIILYSSVRNLMGPFHYIDAEPISVFPPIFTFENDWNNGICERFSERYAFVPFGMQVYILEGE